MRQIEFDELGWLFVIRLSAVVAVQHLATCWELQKGRESIVTNTLLQRVSKTFLRAPRAALTFVAMLGFGVVTTQSAQAQFGDFALLYHFTGPDGNSPFGGVIQDGAGNVYGTTAFGGAYNAGTVFKVDTNDSEAVLHSFQGGSDGAYPFAGLVQDAAGNLYGTTEFGGTGGIGTVFKVDTSGSETVLQSFGGGSSGAYPTGGLLLDKAGNLYGASLGGSSGSQSDFFGDVFEVFSGGGITVLHYFAGGPTDGASPDYSGLLVDKAGTFYGVTELGGADNLGAVYELSPSGTETLLHSFVGGTKDGCLPFGTPFMDEQGNLYGTTYACGSFNQGIVWKLSTKGTETVLHNFDTNGSSDDGAYPFAGVIQDKAGNLYGTTCGGGNSRSQGTLYQLTPTGRLTVLHTFFVENDGVCPRAGVIQDAQGNLYGTVPETDHNDNDYGSVWEYIPLVTATVN